MIEHRVTYYDTPNRTEVVKYILMPFPLQEGERIQIGGRYRLVQTAVWTIANDHEHEPHVYNRRRVYLA